MITTLFTNTFLTLEILVQNKVLGIDLNYFVLNIASRHMLQVGDAWLPPENVLWLLELMFNIGIDSFSSNSYKVIYTLNP